MTDGRRWLALDADMFGKPFTLDLLHEFGWAGIGTWVAFLCACKRSRIPGSIRFLNEADARAQLGILGLDLVDNHGKEWTLDDFWLFTGRKKQTRRTRRGREMNVISTHWEHWQEAARTQKERERKRRSYDENGRRNLQTAPENARRILRPDLDLDLDNPPTPRRAGGFGRRSAPKPQDQPRPPIPDWQPDPGPADPVDRAALAALRAEHGWTKPAGE